MREQEKIDDDIGAGQETERRKLVSNNFVQISIVRCEVMRTASDDYGVPN